MPASVKCQRDRSLAGKSKSPINTILINLSMFKNSRHTKMAIFDKNLPFLLIKIKTGTAD